VDGARFRLTPFAREIRGNTSPAQRDAIGFEPAYSFKGFINAGSGSGMASMSDTSTPSILESRIGQIQILSWIRRCSTRLRKPPNVGTFQKHQQSSHPSTPHLLFWHCPRLASACSCASLMCWLCLNAAYFFRYGIGLHARRARHRLAHSVPNQSDSAFASFFGTNPDGFLNRRNENLPVPNLARFSGFDDRRHGSVDR